MSFLIYDVSFLIIFIIIISILLYKNKKHVKREMGIAFLYRAQWGVKLIDYVGKKYKRTLNALKYVIIPLSYLLMISIIFLIGRAVYSYVRYPWLTKLVKAPPLAPVIPYFPKIFGMESFFPPFYFTYFIVAIAIVAIVHEFSHGIFMRHNNVRIKSTGLAFFGPFMGAFVEQNDEDLDKQKKSDQMAILGAGVFANFVFAIIFLLIWIGLFYMTFIPSGTMFNAYTLGQIEISSIESIDGINITNPTKDNLIQITENEKLTTDLILDADGKSLNFTSISSGGKTYFITLEILKKQLKENESYIVAYYDFPAIRSGLRGTIIEIDGTEIETYNDLAEIMETYNPSDEINLKTNYNEKILEYNIILAEDPYQKGRAVFGISNTLTSLRFDEQIAFFKHPFTYYKIKSEFLLFLYYLVFWVFIINLLVALFNMLPAAILDGGRFFYLTVWGITKNEKFAKKAYKAAGYIILFAFLLMMFFWFIRRLPVWLGI